MNAPAISHLERRKIEAGVLVPTIEAFQRAFGKEPVNEAVRDVVLELARQDGSRWAEQHGNDLNGLEKVSQVWAGGGSLELKPVQRTETASEFNVTRCKYAEHFQALGLPKLGTLIHCNRDFAMLEGFSDGLTLKRTHTIMPGASHCDFRFRMK